MGRDSNSGHRLLLPPANWCPIFASRTTQACFPTITFVLSAALKLALSPENYMLPTGNGRALFYCLGVGQSSSPQTLLGDVLIQQYYVDFDRDQRRSAQPTCLEQRRAVAAVSLGAGRYSEHGRKSAVLLTGSGLRRGISKTAVGRRPNQRDDTRVD